jgi:hypothetical protein
MAKTVSFESFTSLEQFLFMMCCSPTYSTTLTCSHPTESFFGLHVGYVSYSQ